MDWTFALLPLIGLSNWLSDNWQLMFGPVFLAFLAIAYKSGLLGTLNARVDADRYKKLYKESVQREREAVAREIECQQRYDAEIDRQSIRDSHLRTQMTGLQEQLDWATSFIASLRASPAGQTLQQHIEEHPPPPPPMIQTTTTSQETSTPPDKLQTY